MAALATLLAVELAATPYQEVPAVLNSLVLSTLLFALQAGEETPTKAPPQQDKPQPEASGDLASQLQRLIEYLEQRSAPGDQPARVGQIGAQSSRRPDRIVSRIYDVGDLFIPAPAYPARYSGDWDDANRVFPELAVAGGTAQPATQIADRSALGGSHRQEALMQQGGMGGGIAGRSGANTPEARPDLDGLVEAITNTITPNAWSSVGGESTITTLGTVLLVSAPEEIQQQVDQFLRLLRQLWGTSRTVRVHAFWLWLNDAELASLFPEGGALAGEVDRKAWATLHESRAGGVERSAGYRAHIACFDGQTVFVTAGDRRLSLSGLKPTVASQAVAYTPEVRVLHQGAVLQITPTARSAAKSVILDVHSRVTQLHDLADQSPDAAVAGDDAEFARFAASLRDTRIDEHHLASTILVPLRTLVLVGGMSGSLDHGADQLYLFVEVAVHEP